MNWFLRRLAEPSTAAGIGGAISTGAGIATGAVPLEYGIAAILASIAAVLAPERAR